LLLMDNERRSEIDKDWPLWLPVMHGIVWVSAFCSSNCLYFELVRYKVKKKK